MAMFFDGFMLFDYLVIVMISVCFVLLFELHGPDEMPRGGLLTK